MINFIKKTVHGVVLSALYTLASFGAISTAYALPAKEVECLSSAAYHEARNQGDKGILAVMHTILNRTKDSRFPSTPCKVIAQPNQFSYYKHNTPIKEKDTYNEIKQLAIEVVQGKHKSLNRGALYFHTVNTKPSWSNKLTLVSVIKDHKFYK